MDISLQLLFAEPAKSQLSKIWERLSLLPDGRALVESPYEPHITVGLFTDVELGPLASGLSSVMNEPFELSFSTVASFPTSEGTLFLCPVVSPLLLQLHERICKLALGLGGAIRQPEYYAPGNWVPHCSVSWRAPQSTILEGMKLLLAEGFPQHAIVNRFGMFHTPDDSLLRTISLTDAG